MVGLGRFELPTSRLSGVRSNQLSYRPSRLCSGSAGTPGPPMEPGLQKLNSARRQRDRRTEDSPIERVTGKTRDSNLRNRSRRFSPSLTMVALTVSKRPLDAP